MGVFSGGATSADVIATHADVVKTNADAVATAADRAQTGLDKVSAEVARIGAQTAESNTVAVVTGGTATLTPTAGKIPLADANGKIAWWLQKGLVRSVTSPVSSIDCSGIQLLPFKSLIVTVNLVTDVTNYVGLLRQCTVSASTAAELAGVGAGMFATIGGIDYNIIGKSGGQLFLEWDSKLKADPVGTEAVFSKWEFKGQYIGSKTFIRNTRRYYTNYVTNELHMMPAGFPCFERNQAGVIGLSVDGAMTNHFIGSQKATAFNNGVYTRTDNTTLAPDGTMTGGTITANAANTWNLRLVDVGSDIDGRTFTISVWIKATNLADVGLNARLSFRRVDGTDIATSVIPITADWVRHELTQTFSAATGKGHISYFFQLNSRDTASVVGESLDVWQMQVVENIKATTDIKTVTTAITTSPDNAQIDIANRPNSANAMSIVAKFSVNGIETNYRYAHVLNFGFGENHLLMRCGSTFAGRTLFYGNINGISFPALVDKQTYTWAITHDGTTVKSYLDGVLDGSMASIPTVGTATKILLGGWNTVDLFGHIMSINFHDSALTAAEAAA